jgi:hypothetical protein
MSKKKKEVLTATLVCHCGKRLLFEDFITAWEHTTEKGIRYILCDDVGVNGYIFPFRFLRYNNKNGCFVKETKLKPKHLLLPNGAKYIFPKIGKAK